MPISAHVKFYELQLTDCRSQRHCQFWGDLQKGKREIDGKNKRKARLFASFSIAIEMSKIRSGDRKVQNVFFDPRLAAETCFREQTQEEKELTNVRTLLIFSTTDRGLKSQTLFQFQQLCLTSLEFVIGNDIDVNIKNIAALALDPGTRILVRELRKLHC